MAYTPMGGSQTNNVLVYTTIGISPTDKVGQDTLVGSWIVKDL